MKPFTISPTEEVLRLFWWDYFCGTSAKEPQPIKAQVPCEHSLDISKKDTPEINALLLLAATLCATIAVADSLSAFLDDAMVEHRKEVFFKYEDEAKELHDHVSKWPAKLFRHFYIIPRNSCARHNSVGGGAGTPETFADMAVSTFPLQRVIRARHPANIKSEK